MYNQSATTCPIRPSIVLASLSTHLEKEEEVVVVEVDEAELFILIGGVVDTDADAVLVEVMGFVFLNVCLVW